VRGTQESNTVDTDNWSTGLFGRQKLFHPRGFWTRQRLVIHCDQQWWVTSHRLNDNSDDDGVTGKTSLNRRYERVNSLGYCVVLCVLHMKAIGSSR
jgi:hypothetical protein